MVRILGTVLPEDKRVGYALTLLYGIGFATAAKILRQAGVDENKKMKALTEEELKKISEIIDKNYKVEGDLKEEVRENINRLKEIGCYRGIRHLRNLPVRGQRTRSNARTKRGKRKTVGAFKKEVWAKLEQQKSHETKTNQKNS
ncbi:MAG: 30S ribosomal protein S13 [Microgenomates group bacterium]